MESQINVATSDLFVVAIVDALFVAAIVGVVYWRFKSGLMIRIFALVLPAFGIIGFLGAILGTFGFTSTNIITIIGSGALVSTVILAWLNRLVVRNLTNQMNELMSNVTQISATASQPPPRVSSPLSWPK
jgi:membrane protein CcdC involved in cytochrome C biogenesis